MHVENTLFWKHPFGSIASHGSLIEFFVLDVEYVLDDNRQPIQLGDKIRLADVTVQRASEVATDGDVFTVRSHLGRYLNYGDLVWGFEFSRANVNDANFASLDMANFPDVMLVRKSYSQRRKQRRGRNFKLKYLAKEEAIRKDEVDKEAADLEAFLNDMEEDAELRAGINIYRNPDYTPAQPQEGDGYAFGDDVGADDDDGDEDKLNITLDIPLDEMVEELNEMDLGDDDEEEEEEHEQLAEEGMPQ